MGIGLFLFYPLILPLFLFGKCLAVLFAGKAILKLSNEDVSDANNFVRSLVFKIWGFDLAAFYISLIIMLIISFNLPFFEGIHSEWGIAHENAYIPAIVYLVCWVLLYIACFSLSNSILKKAIMNESKRKEFFSLLMLATIILWAGLIFLMFMLFPII